MCRMNNLPPRESEPVYRSNKKNSPVNRDSSRSWELPWKWEHLMFKTSGGWGLYVRNSTQWERTDVHLIPWLLSLRKRMRGSSAASLTWAKLQVVLLFGNRLGWRFKPLLLHVGLAAVWRVGQQRWNTDTSKENTVLERLNSFSLCVQVCCYEHRGYYCRVFSLLLPLGLKDDSLWSRGFASATAQT